MISFPFPKSKRLLNRKDFVNLNRSGERYRTKHFTIIINENGLKINRLGITVSKKTGNAVKRNRVKRLVRESFRLHQNAFPAGHDIVFVANKGIEGLMFSDLKEELSETNMVKPFLKMV
jgi:ribonuclease P protein component